MLRLSSRINTYLFMVEVMKTTCMRIFGSLTLNFKYGLRSSKSRTNHLNVLGPPSTAWATISTCSEAKERMANITISCLRFLFLQLTLSHLKMSQG